MGRVQDSPCDLAAWVDGLVANWGRVALALFAAALVAKFIFTSNVERKKLPPGPAPWPILGNITSLGGLPHRSLEKLARKYGGLMYLRLGYVPCIVVSSADAAKQVFKTNDVVFSNRPGSCFFEAFTHYKNIAMSPYGAHWRHLRKICTSELFAHTRLEAYRESRCQEIGTSIKELLEESGTKGPVDLYAWLHRLLSNNLARMVINERCFGTDEKGMQAAMEFNATTSLAFSQAGEIVLSDFIPWLGFITKLQGKSELYGKTRVMTLDMMRKVTNFNERKKLRDQGRDTGKPEDFVDVLLSSTLADGATPLPDDICLRLLMDMFFAGTDTSATTIEWTITELLRHPDAMKLARAELDSVVGSSELVKEDHLHRLPYLNAVVKESFRLHPATPLGLPRESSQPLQLQGYNLPAKTRLFVNQWAIHRDPAVYEEPEEFKPERFLNGPNISLGGDSQYQLVPFGSGRRNCVGMPLAVLVIPLVVAHLVHSVDWSLPKGQEPKDLDMSESFGVSARKTQPLMVYATPRESAALY